MLIMASCWAMAGGPAGGIQPVALDEAGDLLAAARLGWESATASVSTSAGVVTVHEWIWRDSGELLETETTYGVASKGERFKASVETRYLTNEYTPREPGLPVNTPGTVQRTVIGYDGERVTMHRPDVLYAEISGTDSQVGRTLRSVKAMAISPGIAVPRFEQVLPTSDNPNPGPYLLGRQALNGEECLVVESVRTTATGNGTQAMYFRFWVAPQKGFSIVKEECEARGGAFSKEGAVIERAEWQTRQYGDGLWGVSRVQQEEYRVDGSGSLYLSARRTASFSEDYAVNAPVTDDMLAVTLPSGTKVYDELIDAHYVVP